MGNEFKIKKGFISEGDSKVNGTLSAQTINVTTTPTNNNSQTQVLVRNNTSGLVEYRDASTFSGASDANTFVTGYTYNNNNTFTISDNAGSMFTATINQVSGLTVNGILSATTLDGSTILSGGTNLLSIIETLDTYVTGGTVSIPATDNTNSATIGLLYKNSEGVPHTLPFEDTYASGTTFSSNEATLTRNDGSEIFKLSGGTNVTLFNPSSNQIKIDVTIPTDANTFVTGGTYTDSTNTLSLNRNDAVNVDITGITNTYVTGGTVSISATDDTNSGTIGLFYKDSDGTPRTLPFEDTFTTGGTYNNGTKLITFDRNDGNDYNISLSSISTTNTFVTGTTFSSNEATLTRNDSADVFKLSGGTNVTLSNPSSNQIKIDVSIPPGSNTFVTGGTYSDSTNILSLNRNDAVNVDITGLTDSFVTATTLNSTTIELDRNEGLSTLSVDLLPVLSGKTNLTLFNTHTGDTANPHQTSFTNLTSTGHTHPITDVINLQTILDTKVEDGLNVGGGNEIFSGKSGTTLIFRTISGGSNTTITQVGNIQKIDVTIPVDNNTFVTGGTYNSNTDIISLDRNDATTVDITGITDTFTTGGTYDNGTKLITFDRNDGNNYNISLSSISTTNTFVTGTTFSSNESTLTRNDSTDVFKLSGGTNVTLSNPSSNQIKIDVPLLQNQFLLDIYQSGTTTLNESTYTSIPWDAQVILGSNYTHVLGGSNIRVDSSGSYRITYSISIDISSNTRTISRARLGLNGVEIPRSGGYGYHRTSAQGESTISKTIITPLVASDIITLDAIKFTTAGASNILSTISNDSNITITKLNNG